MGRDRTVLGVMARLFVVLTALGVGVLALVLVYFPDRHALLAYLQYLPYPVYLAPVVAATLCTAWLGWRWRVLAGLSVLVVLTVVMGLCLGQPDEGYGRVRFMTYNVKADLAVGEANGLGELTSEILVHDPDVLVMQDAGSLMGVKYRQPEVFAALVGKREVYAYGQYLVASRWPLKDCAPGAIPFRDKKHTFVHCVLTVHGKEVDLVTVHFLTPRDGLNAVRHEGLTGLEDWRENMLDRMNQSRGLAEQVSRMKRPRIVAGDLNAPERSAVVQNLLHTGLRDAYSSSSRGYGFTYGHSLKPGISFLRIDHVLVSDDIGVAAAYAGGSKASQHRPVVVDLQMTRD